MVGSGETVGTAFRQIDDNLGDALKARGGGRLARLKVTSTAEAAEGVHNLRVLGYCANQLPRFDCRIAAHITVEYEGLEGSVSAELSGSVSSWRQLEEALLGIADRGRDVSATMTLEFTPASPIPYDGPEWHQFRSAVTNNDPGALEIVVTLADEGDR